MALTKKQMELDKIKWEISESMGVDACGSLRDQIKPLLVCQTGNDTYHKGLLILF